MEYILIRSKRKTLGLCVDEKGLTVRAPYSLSKTEIEKIINARKGWIDKQMKQVKKEKELIPFTDEELELLKILANEYIPQRVSYYAHLMGVKYEKISIRTQKSKWGSCTSKGNLSFNCLLMMMPVEVIDSIVVHELCHLKVMNHSKDFYKEVYTVYPEYNIWDKWLKENGKDIIARLK